MAWASSGGYPGVASGGNGVLTVVHVLSVGDFNAALTPDISAFFGQLQLNDVPGSNVSQQGPLSVSQSEPLPLGAHGPSAVFVQRTGNISSQDYAAPAVDVIDQSSSTQPVLRLRRGAVTVLSIGARKSITGALSAVTDAAAKAVLTSIIATLTGIDVANDNTT